MFDFLIITVVVVCVFISQVANVTILLQRIARTVDISVQAVTSVKKRETVALTIRSRMYRGASSVINDHLLWLPKRRHQRRSQLKRESRRDQPRNSLSSQLEVRNCKCSSYYAKFLSLTKCPLLMSKALFSQSSRKWPLPVCIQPNSSNIFQLEFERICVNRRTAWVETFQFSYVCCFTHHSM